MKREQVIKALEEEGFKVRVYEVDPGLQIVATEGNYNIGLSNYLIDNKPIEWIVETTKRKIEELKDAAQ